MKRNGESFGTPSGIQATLLQAQEVGERLMQMIRTVGLVSPGPILLDNGSSQASKASHTLVEIYKRSINNLTFAGMNAVHTSIGVRLLRD
ncbi:unnamed protein product [Calypogeia fissa]